MYSCRLRHVQIFDFRITRLPLRRTLQIRYVDMNWSYFLTHILTSSLPYFLTSLLPYFS